MLLKLSILFLFITIAWPVTSKSRKVLVTVYYESNCPDSKAFILEQLQPALQLLHHHITIKFVPFGKARSINYGDGGFECQHGSSECMGNIVQDCSLYLMKEKSDRDKLTYVACEMETLAASQGKFDCVQRANLQTNLVEECVLLGKGTILQLESEYYTNLVNHKFIPTITINDVYIQDIQDYAQVDLVGTLCSLITEAPPCSRYYNLMALHNLMRTNFQLQGNKITMVSFIRSYPYSVEKYEKNTYISSNNGIKI